MWRVQKPPLLASEKRASSVLYNAAVAGRQSWVAAEREKDSFFSIKGLKWVN